MKTKPPFDGEIHAVSAKAMPDLNSPKREPGWFLGDAPASPPAEALPSQTSGAERQPWDIESLAQWLHDETEHQESYPGCHWPEHPDDDGNRDGGFIKIVPKHAQAYFRQMAARCFGVRPFSDAYFRALRGEPAALAKPASEGC